jgi:hypothetical protein
MESRGCIEINAAKALFSINSQVPMETEQSTVVGPQLGRLPEEVTSEQYKMEIR